MSIAFLSHISTSLGDVGVAVTQVGLGRVTQPPEHANTLESWARTHNLTPLKVGADDARVKPYLDALRSYYSRDATAAQRLGELSLDLRGTDFQRAVWLELRRIPFGNTSSYGEVAKRLGKPAAARAVGAACGNNPVCPVVPCHRVLASGGVGGFALGLDRKSKLLQLEGTVAGRRKHADVADDAPPPAKKKKTRQA